MSRREHLKPQECERIRRLAELGVKVDEIARRTGRSRSSIWRVLNDRVPVVWPASDVPMGRNVSKLLETSMALRLETRIESDQIRVEGDMPTAELVQESFVSPLRVHYSVNKPDPDRFVADLVATLLEEKFSTSVLKLAVRNFIRTRRAPNFPSVADCIVACRAAQGELPGGSISNSDRLLTDSDEETGQ